MSSLPTWTILPIAALVMLLSPVFGFLTAIGVEILIGVLHDGGMLPGLAVGAFGAIIWSMLRKLWSVRAVARQPGREPRPAD
jgi:hypothetical protein